MQLRPLAPRASRSADMVASVPELTNRTNSSPGTSRASCSAISVSAWVGAPKESPRPAASWTAATTRSEEHTSELQSHVNLVCRLLLEKKKKNKPHLPNNKQQNKT